MSEDNTAGQADRYTVAHLAEQSDVVSRHDRFVQIENPVRIAVEVQHADGSYSRVARTVEQRTKLTMDEIAHAAEQLVKKAENRLAPEQLCEYCQWGGGDHSPHCPSYEG